MLKVSIPTIIVAVILSGCSTIAPPARLDGAGAVLHFNVSSDSTRTTGRHWRISQFQDRNCVIKDKGRNLVRSAYGALQERLGPVVIEPETPITIGMLYIESRIAQNRECSFTFTYKPKVAERYEINFDVVEESTICSATVKDSLGTPVEVEVPEYSCAIGLTKKVRNGRPGTLNWNIQVVP